MGSCANCMLPFGKPQPAAAVDPHSCQLLHAKQAHPACTSHSSTHARCHKVVPHKATTQRCHTMRRLTLWVCTPAATGGQVAGRQPGRRAGHGARVASGPPPLQGSVEAGISRGQHKLTCAENAASWGPLTQQLEHPPAQPTRHPLTHSTQRSQVTPAGRRYRQLYSSPPIPARIALAYMPGDGAGEGPPSRGIQEKGPPPSALRQGGGA